MAESAPERVLQVRATSAGLDPRSLAPGRDLTLRVPTEHGLDLPHGVALDDYLDAAARALVDERARERWGRWRDRRTEALPTDGVDLASIAQIELLARCFFPAARVEIGLPRALTGVRTLALHGLTPGQASLLRAVASGQGLRVTEATTPGDGGAPLTAPPPLPARISAAAGVPRRLRGQVLCVPYWNLTPVYRDLASRADGAHPAAAGVMLPGLGPASTMRVAVRGGWLGHPGLRTRRRAATAVDRVIDAARGEEVPADPLDAALDAAALDLLQAGAPTVLAAARHARRAFASGPVRSLLVPFDGTAEVAVLVDEARRAAVPSLLVQHGFDSRMGAPDKSRVDVAALWSERDRTAVARESRARLEVTGNPGAEHLAGRVARAGRHGRTLVLVDYPSRLSARITERVGQRHVAAALEALAAARPGTTALIRPHPSEQHAEAYLRVPSALHAELDKSASLEATLATVDLCIGAMSTATLQAAAVGVPVVYLEVAGYQRPWPLDGSVVPTAHDSEGLAEAVTAALAAREIAGQPEMIEALGVRPGATAAVCDLIDDLV